MHSSLNSDSGYLFFLLFIRQVRDTSHHLETAEEPQAAPHQPGGADDSPEVRASAAL